MRKPKKTEDSDPRARARSVEQFLANAFGQAGWNVRPNTKSGSDVFRPDMVIDRAGQGYAVELKVASEGRKDRLIPLWSQAFLQASRAAAGKHQPLAVVAAPHISPQTAEQILDFAAQYAPGAGAGVMDFAGFRRFRGAHLETMNAGDAFDQPIVPSALQRDSSDLFSDLNQWLLKVLLAPELPTSLLSPLAPRDRYQGASALARAANVSIMSASRFIRQIEREGYRDSSAPYLRLVRREDLFHRWASSAAARPVKEIPMRFLLPQKMDILSVLDHENTCLGLFTAADMLNMGFVHGVPPHVYMKRLSLASLSRWKRSVPAAPHEVPNFIVRQAPAPESIFRGAVVVEDMLVSDVLQVWLDVLSHPARGLEQAEQIYNRVIRPLIDNTHIHG